MEADSHCPPEDVGGSPGYEEFLAAITDPNHERHAEMIQWTGFDSNDPTKVDIEATNVELARIAKRWDRKPRMESSRRA